MRLPEGDLALIDRAASLQGRSRTDFVREAAVRAAEATLIDTRIFRMSGKAFAHFLAEIDESAEPVAALVELAQRCAPWERDSGKKR